MLESANKLIGRLRGGQALPQPSFCRAQRWGSAFYHTGPVLRELKGADDCLWNAELRLTICGDFCSDLIGVHGACSSGHAAAMRMLEAL